MNNSHKYIVLLLLLTTGQFAFAQADTAKEKAQMMATQAILFEGRGKTAEAIPLLEGAKKLDSGNINYHNWKELHQPEPDQLVTQSTHPAKSPRTSEAYWLAGFFQLMYCNVKLRLSPSIV